MAMTSMGCTGSRLHPRNQTFHFTLQSLPKLHGGRSPRSEVGCVVLCDTFILKIVSDRVTLSFILCTERCDSERDPWAALGCQVVSMLRWAVTEAGAKRWPPVCTGGGLAPGTACPGAVPGWFPLRPHCVWPRRPAKATLSRRETAVGLRLGIGRQPACSLLVG